MPLNYPWDLLRERGHCVFTPGAQANQVARLAKAYVARHVHPDAKVVTITTVEGALTVLAYVPQVSRAKAREPSTTAHVEEPTPSNAQIAAKTLSRLRHDEEEDETPDEDLDED